MKRVVIIGGGISGLSAAYYLKRIAQEKRINLSYTLIEKNNRLGGNIITEKVGDFIVEGGPDCFIFEKPWVLELCKQLGLIDKVINTNKGSKTYILWKNKLRELPEGFVLMIPTKIMPFIFNSLISVPGKLRMALDLIIPKGDSSKDESLSEFVGRRLGKEAVEKIAEPLVAGIHAGNPETMSVKSSFPRFINMEQKHRSLIIAMLKARKQAKKAVENKSVKYTMFLTLKDGLTELVNAIVNTLDEESIIKGKKVLSIEGNKDDNSYIIEIEGKDPIKADAVILTTPTYVSADLLKDIDPEIADNLRKIPYVSTATVSMAFKKSDIRQLPQGYGFVVPRLEKRKIIGATFVSQKFPLRAPEDSVLIRCFIGGSKNEDLADLDRDSMAKMARDELKDILGIDAKPVFIKVYKFSKAMSQRNVGHEDIVKAIDKGQKLHPGLFITGSAYKGTGLSDSVHNGELTASKVLETSKTVLEVSTKNQS